MGRFPAICAILLATTLAAEEKPGGRPGRARVLDSEEPPDSVVLTLPGAPPPAAAATPSPAPQSAQPPAPSDDHRPLLRRAPKPVLPAEFERDSAAFTQTLIGLWIQPDAYNLYGEPLRERAVIDETGTENGRVYAFSDPTGRYREVELDFAKDTGLLRTVFVYPWKMTWQECRKLWGANVHTTKANKGRIFYSYVNRRLDVLVDSDGIVVSLGLY